MKRPIVAALAVALLALAGGCGRKTDLARPGLVQVGKHTWAMIATGPSSVEGLGANAGFVVGRDAVLVVDARYTPPLADEMVRAIRGVSQAPIRYVVNTHYHHDHTWGNSVFKAQGATIVAREETRDAFVRYSPIYLSFYRERSPEAAAMLKDVVFAPPDTVFEDGETIDLGGVKVVLRHFGAGHTAGDAVVVVPADKVAFTGGLVSNGYHPNMADPGGDFDGWLRSLDRIGRLRVKRLVPGQGYVCGKEVLEKERAYIRAIRSAAVAGIEKLVPLEETIQTIAIPGTEGYLQPNLLPFNVQAVYRHEIPRIVKPDFAVGLPTDFLVTDGGGGPKRGYIRWATQDKERGYLELEVQWKASARRELIPADVAEYVARAVESGRREMRIEGTRRLEIGKLPAVGAYGAWNYKKETGDPRAGAWSWAMLIEGGKLYSIQCATETGLDRELEKRNIAYLDTLAGTFRIGEK